MQYAADPPVPAAYIRTVAPTLNQTDQPEVIAEQCCQKQQQRASDLSAALNAERDRGSVTSSHRSVCSRQLQLQSTVERWPRHCTLLQDTAQCNPTHARRPSCHTASLHLRPNQAAAAQCLDDRAQLHTAARSFLTEAATDHKN